MNGNTRIKKRFEDLEVEAEAVAQTVYCDPTPMVGGDKVDSQQSQKWSTSVESFLRRLFPEDDPVIRDFASKNKFGSKLPAFREKRAILASAREQFEGGYLFDLRNLVHADVFSNELEQAKHFLDGGHKVPAAVIAGTVLETTLRELCNQHPDLEPSNSINPMNQDLAGKGLYNRMRADQIQAWGKLRNDAAHGNPDEFESPEVARMIDGIRDFIAGHMN